MRTRALPSMANELVPLALRLHAMQGFRALLVTLVIGFRVAFPELVKGSMSDLVLAACSYAIASLVGEFAWRASDGRSVRLFGAMLLADGIFLAHVSYATGGATSPMRYLLFVHLVAVTLLASYRTGLKMALWHSLLLFVVHHAQRSGLVDGAAGSTDYATTVSFIVAFWVVAIVTATFSAVNERELRRRKYDLGALAAMADDLAQQTKPLAVARVLLESASTAFDFRRGVVIGVHEDGLRVLASSDDQQVERVLPSPDDALLRRVWSLHSLATVGVLDEELDRHLTALLPAAVNVVVAPMFAEGRAMGALVLERGGGPETRIDRRVLVMVEQFAAHAALALRNAWLLDEVRQMADTDALTGVANRRTFQRELDAELVRAARRHEPVSLVLADIDHFESVNDRFGHQTGDDVLADVAAILSRESRQVDVVARCGGEEFAIILPGCDSEEAAVIAERLRAAVIRATTAVPVTVSLGVATYPDCAPSAAGLVAAADAALDGSKRAGRNLVTVSDRTVAGEQRTLSG